MLPPAQFFQHPATGTRDKVREMKDDVDVRRKHNHEGKGSVEGKDSELWDNQQKSEEYFQSWNQPSNYTSIGAEQRRLCKLNGKSFKIHQFACSRINEEEYK